MDALACVLDQGTACVVLQSFRAGVNQGTRAFFPRVQGSESSNEVLSAFVCQYYLEHQPPRGLLLSEPIDNAALLERSEEHTSALQSLMRISYAGFCLKTNKQQNNHTSH